MTYIYIYNGYKTDIMGVLGLKEHKTGLKRA